MTKWEGSSRVAAAAKDRGLVILAGAGVSMPPPSCLPGWRDFNDLVLDALARRVGEATGGLVDGPEVLHALQTLRGDNMEGFPPDFQAQLMEEECDTDYYRVLQVLDVDVRNRCHEAIAAIAGTGVVRAIVTTNFDRLIELALEARGIPHQTFFTPDHFEALPGRSVDVVPVIKAHGSVESAESMVDTLRQRMQGRPEPLQRALADLFSAHACLTLGFSGADLAYQPGYLGLASGAPRCPSFTVMNRAGTGPHPAMQELLAAVKSTGRVIDGTLPEDLIDLAVALGAVVDTAGPSVDPATLRAERMAQLRLRVDAWVDSLGHVTAINVLSALVEGRSSRGGFEILRTARRHGLGVPDTGAPGYWRFQVNFGRQLLARGINGGDMTADECYRELHEGRLDHQEPDDAFRILLRAAYRGDRFDARAHLALAHLHRGECDLALEAADAFAQEAIAEGYSLPIIDGVIALATVCSLTGQWSVAIEWLEAVYPFVQRVGDEPRRARMCALLGRTLAFKARDEEAERYLTEGVRIAEKLGLGLILADVRAAWGYFEFERGNVAAALPLLTWASKTLARAEQRASLIPVLLDLAPVAFRAGEMDVCRRALAAAEEELDRFPGYYPRYHQRVGHMFVWQGQRDKAREALAQLRATGDATKNPWAEAAAAQLERLIER